MKCLCNQNQTVSNISLKTFINTMMKHERWVGSMSNLKKHTTLIYFLRNMNDFEFKVIVNKFDKIFEIYICVFTYI